MAHKAPKKRKEKHPKDMTTEEAIKHLFHPKVVEHVKKHVEKK
jgi:hypothetical protein